MEQEQNNNKNEFKDRILFWIKENKLKIIFSFIFLLTILIILIAKNIHEKKQNNLISEKYIQAGLLLSKGEKEKSLKVFEEIIKSKNKFYSVLALNSILEKKLTEDKEKILNFFEKIEDLNIEKNQKDLVMFKKALYLIKNSNSNAGNALLEYLIKSDSELKFQAEEILDK
tara:strand:- start:21 stop:533 length:513 start_codon:yes stop_codon:yes gene_type:complete